MFNKKITGRKIDYSSMTSCPNVDTMCDVLVSAQKETGVPVSLNEAEYDKMGKKIPRYRRLQDGQICDTRTGEIVDKNRERPIPIIKPSSNVQKTYSPKKHSISKEKKDDEQVKPKKESKHVPLVERGFVNFYNGVFGNEDDDDDDDTYICEYCTNLGYSGKYKAHVCDNCTKCEGCSEFMNGSCDGCTFSRTRTGRLYSETLGLDQIVDPDDLEILEESRNSNDTQRRKFGGFSMLNY